MKLAMTPLCIAIHSPDESPIFGDGAIHVSLADDAAGPYLVIRQLASDEPQEPGEIRLDFDELDAIRVAAVRLIDGHNQKVRTT